jgi:hypothetical protein
MIARALAPSFVFVAVLAASCASDPDASTSTSEDAGATDASAAHDVGNVTDVGPSADAKNDVATEGGTADPCTGKTVACPTAPAGFTEGGGLAAIDRCAFPMKIGGGFATSGALVTALETIAPHVTTATVFGDLNRTAVANKTPPGAPAAVQIGFEWEAEEETSTTWTPQGLTGSADASSTGLVDGKRIVVASSYFTPPTGSTYEKGVRIAFVDVTTPATPKYRFALLVEPKGTAAAPDFAPVLVHAGGIVWFGNLLYVADTGKGFRVFDMSRIMQVATDTDVIGCTGGTCHAGLYKYVVPQIGTYGDTSACAPIYSYVALDRSSSPPSLVSGEYCSAAPTVCSGNALAGRAFRWPLDPATGKLAGAATSWPSEAFLLGQKQVQGAVSRNGTFYMSSSAPAGSGGALYRVKPGKSATSAWVNAPEDLMIDEPNGLVWSQSEGVNARVVFGASLTSYPPP